MRRCIMPGCAADHDGLMPTCDVRERLAALEARLQEHEVLVRLLLAPVPLVTELRRQLEAYERCQEER